jgi:hypothetical protein
MAVRKRAPGAPEPAKLTDEEYRAKGLVPFLRPGHVRDGEQLKLTGFNVVQPDGQIVCDVANAAGIMFRLGVREGSPDHRCLHYKLGPEPKKWLGSVTIAIAPGRTPDHPGFVNVADAEPDEPPF